jgi:uncharacterized membrane protein required for colicin V production
MIFTLVDVVLILILFIFITTGVVLGLIRTIGALVGLLLGTWMAGHYFVPLADWLTPILRGNVIAGKIVAFLLIFVIINRLTILLFHLLDKAFSLLSFIPFAKSLNRFGGLILGAVEGILTLGILIFVVAKFAPNSGFVIDSLNNSQIAHLLVTASTWLTALLPEAFDKIKSVF